MGIEGLDYRVIQIPLSAGLKTSDDQRAMQPPGLSICADARFDDIGGIQTRFPLTSIGNNISGGGTLANVRRLETVNGELVVFTDTQVYSWNAQLSVWVLRGTHMAVTVDERGVFVGTGDQIDADRAELNGTIVYAWTEVTTVFAAALDKVTGALLVAPTAVSTAVGRPKLVALATKILLFVDAGANNLTVRSIDPATPSTAIAGAGTSVIAANFNAMYDVVKVEGQDLAIGACRRVTTTSYSVFTVTPALAVTAVTKARTCDGPIAVTTTLGAGTSAQIARANTTNIQGDLLTTSSLADVFTGQALGASLALATIKQVAVAYLTTTTAAVFWSSGESADGTTGTAAVGHNTVTTANVVGTSATLVLVLGMASRAFSFGGHAYVWLVFACDSGAAGFGVPLGIRAALQNTYFLYRDDGLLVSRAAFDIAGGFAPSSGRLPGVATTSTTGFDFAWCGAYRRAIDLGDGQGAVAHTGFDARSPRDIAFSFDSNSARRCARIGRTLYVTGGIPMQYDGAGLFEVGFLISPFVISGATSGPGTGNLAAGAYSYKSTMRWLNAQGEQERSTTAIGLQLTAAALDKLLIGTIALNVTLKAAARIAPAIELWRTAVNPQEDNPYFLITSKDPTALTNPNRYIPNDVTLNQDPAVFTQDNFADATLATKEANPENGSVLESLPPPGASIIFATDTRVFLGGLDGDPDSVAYSRLRGAGEIVSFHDTLVIPVPRDGGAMTALALLNETLVVFRESCVYALPGLGFDNTGGGQNYGPANRLSADVGAVNADAVALTPMGLIFKSDKGWYMLDRSWNARYIGAEVALFDGETVRAVHVMVACHQVRCVTSGRILVYDYLVDNWTSWSISDAVHATIWNGVYYYLSSTSNAPLQEQTSYPFGSVNYGLDVELGWIKPADLQGFARIDQILIVGEFRGAHALWIRTAFDYEQDGAGNWRYTDSVFWTPSPQVIGSVEQVSRGTSRGRCQAIKVRITAVAPAKDGTPPTTEALKLTGIALRVGFYRTPYKRLPAAQKT